ERMVAALKFGELVMAVLALHNEVLDAVNSGATIVPAAEDVSACESFGAGYAAGAALDPAWVGDDDRWTFASCFAYLGGRPELGPNEPSPSSTHSRTSRKRSVASSPPSCSQRMTPSSRCVAPPSRAALPPGSRRPRSLARLPAPAARERSTSVAAATAP